MSKYEYAYYDSERRLIAVADIREESKKDPHIYMQRYEGHLLCPECKQARLIVVQGADFPFFRAAPRSAHMDGCDFIRPEYPAAPYSVQKKKEGNLYVKKIQSGVCAVHGR